MQRDMDATQKMLSFVWSTLILFAVVTESFAADPATKLRNGTVYMRGNRVVFKDGFMDTSGSAAFGYYDDSVLVTGWSTLEIKSGRQEALSDKQRAFAAGYLEGALTAREIVVTAANMKRFWKVSSPKFKEVFNWLQKQDDWARAFVEGNPQDPTARMLGYILSQADGLIKGVQDQVGATNFTKLDFFVIANGGDLIDLTSILVDTKVDLSAMSTVELRQYIALRGMCSALVKVTPGLENIIMSHATWFTYSATLRIFKHYHLQFDDSSVATGRISFSSYPGILNSLDAFYVLGSQMVLLQTTNNIFNDSLYSNVSPASLLAWQRVQIANHLSSSGQQWADYLSKHNSGTYNNQYMVIDLKRVHLKTRIDDGALTIAEQIPGLVVSSDQTSILQNGHWPSYNVPFHELIYNLSGYAQFVRKHGEDFSYQMAPRAKLFRRDANNVKSVMDMQRLMRSNNYTKDPYSQGDPTSAVCSRGDLIAKHPSPMGCMDGKVTDFKMALNLQATAINGPTRGDGSLPIFTWRSPKFSDFPHAGLPTFYNYTWRSMKPLH